MEPLHAEEASRANLQCDGGVAGTRTGITEGLVPLGLPLGSVGDVGLELHGHLQQVDGACAPDVSVRALVGDGNVLWEVVLAWKVGHSLRITVWKWCLQKSKVTSSFLVV